MQSWSTWRPVQDSRASAGSKAQPAKLTLKNKRWGCPYTLIPHLVILVQDVHASQCLTEGQQSSHIFPSSSVTAVCPSPAIRDVGCSITFPSADRQKAAQGEICTKLPSGPNQNYKYSTNICMQNRRYGQ